MKNILLLGHNGFVGSNVNDILSIEEGVRVHTLDLKITKNNLSCKKLTVSSLIDDLDIDVIVNCIAKANLDQCEEDKEACKLINTEFVKAIVDILRIKTKVKLVHISTNAVYDGKFAPYNEGAECHPINYYGVCKAKADKYIEENLENYAIARPITVYGPKSIDQRDNPVSFIIKKLISGEDLKLVDDNIVNMIHVDDLKHAIKKLALGEHLGVFNISGDVSECRYELGVRVLKILKLESEKIKKVDGSCFSVKAPRPLDTSFDNSKMKNELGIRPIDIDLAIEEIIEKKAY